MVVPARVRSAYGDMTKAAAGRGSPCSRALTRVAMASPPPADSPAKAMAGGGGPLCGGARRGPAPGALPREGVVRGGCAVVRGGPVGGRGVAAPRGVRVLGGEPV